MTNSFYALAFRQKYIQRWGLMRSITPEYLASHSYEVAITAHALALIGNKFFGKKYDEERALALGLFHDMPEVFTGDLPTPVKYFNSQIRENYGSIEENASRTMLSKLDPALACEYESLFGLTQKEGDGELLPLIKAADKLCALIKCIEEEKVGNGEFRSAHISTRKKIDEIELDEVKWFSSNVLPAFELDLDEQSK